MSPPSDVASQKKGNVEWNTDSSPTCAAWRTLVCPHAVPLAHPPPSRSQTPASYRSVIVIRSTGSPPRTGPPPLAASHSVSRGWSRSVGRGVSRRRSLPRNRPRPGLDASRFFPVRIRQSADQAGPLPLAGAVLLVVSEPTSAAPQERLGAAVEHRNECERIPARRPRS